MSILLALTPKHCTALTMHALATRMQGLQMIHVETETPGGESSGPQGQGPQTEKKGGGRRGGRQCE